MRVVAVILRLSSELDKIDLDVVTFQGHCLRKTQIDEDAIWLLPVFRQALECATRNQVLSVLHPIRHSCPRNVGRSAYHYIAQTRRGAASVDLT